MFRFFLVFLLISFNAFSQVKTYQLVCYGIDKEYNYQKFFTDSVAVIAQVDSLSNSFLANGYLLSEIESALWVNQKLSVYFKLNNQYQFARIENGNIEAQLLNKILSDKQKFRNKNFTVLEINRLRNSLIAWYENNGYPFAQVWLDSLSMAKNELSLKLFANPNQNITIDTIKLAGDAKIDSKYLNAYLGIRNGDNYQENKIAALNRRLKDLSFISQPKDPEILFSGDKATINLFLNKQNANQFDGILGFLPNAATGKLQITGDFRLKLQNALKHGEQVEFNYKGLPQQSQELLFKAGYPYIFNSKLGFDIDFNFFKKDSSFLNLSTKIGFSYLFSPDKQLNFFIDNYNGNLVGNADSTESTGLPAFTDISATFYGIGGFISRLDNKITPIRGYRCYIQAGLGERSLNKTQNFNPDDIPDFAGNATQFKLQADLNYYLNLWQKSVLYFRNQSAALIGTKLFTNEAFRIGGFKVLRGFDEQSILASSYLVQTLEYRYMIEKNSFLFTFFDQALINQDINSINNALRNPFGFGAGINFQTKIGIASLSYALGKQPNNPINLQNGKIHFGLVNYF